MSNQPSVMVVFGTRPEVIKLAPVINALKEHPLELVNVSTNQQRDLMPGFLNDFGVHIHESLDVMREEQSLNRLLARLSSALDDALKTHDPTIVVVQGDTASALAGALVAYNHLVPVAHVEAGLRTGLLHDPFPEEGYRKIISSLTSLHLAATQGNVDALIAEGIASKDICLSGNPVVDSLSSRLRTNRSSTRLTQIVDGTAGKKIILLTMHRRENLGTRLDAYLERLAQFVAASEDLALIGLLHPNPKSREQFTRHLGAIDNVQLVEPLGHGDFLQLIQRSTLVLSDSGGIQEEVISLRTPLLVLREATERPEALTTGLVRLVPNARFLDAGLSWALGVAGAPPNVENPFGDGFSGPRIAQAIWDFSRTC